MKSTVFTVWSLNNYSREHYNNCSYPGERENVNNKLPLASFSKRGMVLSVSHENALNNFLDLVFKFAFKFSWHPFVVVAVVVVVLEEKQQN